MIRENFNAGWQIEKGGQSPFVSAFSAGQQGKAVHLPYDAMIHEERDPHTPSGSQSGFYPGGTYVYQKQFTAPAEWREEPVYLAFEGVYQVAMVYVNGYADFLVELSPYLQYGGENRITDESGQDDLFHQHSLTVSVKGAGTLEALGSAIPSSEGRYDTGSAESYDGYCLAVVRAAETPGTICLTVAADNGEEQTLLLQVR